MSLPSRGAWIEILILKHLSLYSLRRSLHGERGLKSALVGDDVEATRRSLHGERGLKCDVLCLLILALQVAPFTGSVD